MLLSQIWGEEALQFQEKLLNSSGLGDETYFPDSKTPSHGRQHMAEDCAAYTNDSGNKIPMHS